MVRWLVEPTHDREVVGLYPATSKLFSCENGNQKLLGNQKRNSTNRVKILTSLCCLGQKEGIEFFTPGTLFQIPTTWGVTTALSLAAKYHLAHYKHWSHLALLSITIAKITERGHQMRNCIEAIFQLQESSVKKSDWAIEPKVHPQKMKNRQS